MYLHKLLALAVAVLISGCWTSEPPRPPEQGEQMQQALAEIEQEARQQETPRPEQPGETEPVPSAVGEKPKLPPRGAEDPEEPIDETSGKILSDSEKSNLPNLVKLLEHQNPRVRLEAVNALRQLSELTPETLTALAGRINDPNLKVRRSAVEYFHWYGGYASERERPAEALPELVKLLDYPEDPEFLVSVMQLLGRYGAKAEPAIPGLVRQLERKTDNYSLNSALLETLGKIGVKTPQAVPAIVAQLENLPRPACYALGRMGYTKPLLAFWKDQQDYKGGYALIGLGHVHPTTPEILQALREELQQGIHSSSREVAEALGLVRPSSPEVVELLKVVLTSNDGSAREVAATSLGTLDPQQDGVLELLLQATSDADEDVRRAATTSLGKLQGSPQTRYGALARAFLSTFNHASRNALGENEAEALPILQEIATDNQKTAEQRTAAVAAIAYLHDGESEELLKLAAGWLTDAGEPISLRAMAAYDLWEDGDGHPDCFAVLLQALKDSPYHVVRDFCAIAVSELGEDPQHKPQAVAALIAALPDQEGETAGSAAEGLAELRDPAAFEPLKRLALDPKAPHRRAGLGALRSLDGKLGEAVTVYLQVLKTDKDLWNRDAAAEQIAYIFSSDERTPEDIPNLSALVAGLTAGLRDEEDNVRAECASALGFLGAAAAPAIDRLTVLVQDRNFDTSYRMRAVWTLGQIGEPARQTLPVIIACLNEESIQDNSDNLRDGLSVLLNLKASDEQLLPLLRQALNRPLNAWDMADIVKLCIPLGPRAAPLKARLIELLDHESEEVREVAAEALGGLGEAGKDATPKLASLAISDPDGDVRRASLQALMTLQPDHPQVMEALVSGLRSEDTRYGFREMILARPAQAMPALLNGLDDESISLRREIFSILSELPDQKALTPVYVKGIEDENQELRQAAALALSKIGGYPAQVIPVMIAALQQEELDNRYEYSSYLQQIGGLATAPLVAAIVDPRTSAAGRQQLQQALGYEPELLQADREQLEAATQSEQLPIRAAALLALLRAEPEPEETRLAPLLELVQSDDEEARDQALNYLSRFPRQRQQIIPLLLQRLQQDEEAYGVAYVLGGLMEAAHLPELLKLLEDPKSRSNGLRALQQMEELPETVAPRLLDLLKASNDEEEREALVAALSHIGPAILPEFAKLLEDRQTSLELKVACLEELRSRFSQHPEARKLVEPLLKDENIQVSVTAAITLAGLTPEEETPPVELLPLLLKGALDAEHQYYLAGGYRRFRQQGSSVYPELQKMLDSENPQHRREALLAIAPLQADAPELLNRIVERLRSGDEDVDASNYAEALVEIGPPAIPALAQALGLESLDAEVKQSLLRQLGYKIEYLDEEEDRKVYQPLLAPLEKLLAGEDLPRAAQAGAILQKLAPAAFTEKTLAVARQALESTEEENRAAGLSLAVELREAAEPLLPLLLPLLEHAELRDSVFAVLRQLGDKATPAIPEVVKFSETKAITSEAISFFGTLGEQGKPAVPLLKQLLRNERWMTQAFYALRESAAVAPEELFQAVQPLLEQPQYRVPILKLLKDVEPLPAATMLFTALLDDPDATLRAFAVRYLSRAAREDAALSQKLLDLAQNDPSFAVRRTLLGSLRQRGLNLPPETQVAAWLKILSGPEPRLYGQAAYLLGDQGEQAAPAVPRLVELLDSQSSDPSQPALLYALAEIGPAAEPALPKLREFLKQSGGRQVQSYAFYLAEQLGDKALPALPELIALAASPDKYLAERAARLAWKLDPAAAKTAGLPAPKTEE